MFLIFLVFNNHNQSELMRRGDIGWPSSYHPWVSPLFVSALFLGPFCRRLDGIHQCAPRHGGKQDEIKKTTSSVFEISVLTRSGDSSLVRYI